jgi:class 3 adenylate cyclase
MGLQEDLLEEVAAIFRARWNVSGATVVPEADSVTFKNEAKELEDAVVLYADLSHSTKLVDEKSWQLAAEVYKTFLHCAAKVIRAEGGTITAYDGDRIMAIYLGDYKNTSAARTALKINWVRVNIINPLLKKQYPDANYEVSHLVGIDRSTLRAAKTGVRGDNDLVWVGTAANHAAKLSSLSEPASSWITGEVYDSLAKVAKYTDGESMWEARSWSGLPGRKIYRSTWTWKI